IDLLLLRLSQGIIELPQGVSIEEFLLSEGKARPRAEAEAKKADGPVPFSEFRDKYLEARSGGSMEANSLATTRMHLKHFERVLGAGFDMRKLALSDLQRHLNSRREAGDPRRKQNPSEKPISPVTLRLEVSTLKAAWNWAI